LSTRNYFSLVFSGGHCVRVRLIANNRSYIVILNMLNFLVFDLINYYNEFGVVFWDIKREWWRCSDRFIRVSWKLENNVGWYIIGVYCRFDQTKIPMVTGHYKTTLFFITIIASCRAVDSHPNNFNIAFYFMHFNVKRILWKKRMWIDRFLYLFKVIIFLNWKWYF